MRQRVTQEGWADIADIVCVLRPWFDCIDRHVYLLGFPLRDSEIRRDLKRQSDSQRSRLCLALPTCFCVRSRSHAPASNTKPLCPTLCSSAGRQRVRSRSHAPLACSRYLFAPPYVCFRHSLAAEREGRVTIKRKLQVCVCLDSCICVLCCLAIVSQTKCTSCTRFLTVLISFALE